MTLRISHRVMLDRSGPRGMCVWCGQTTDIWALTPFRPDIGRLPLHLFCGVWLRDAYKAAQAGLPMQEDWKPGLQRLLEAGGL